MKQKNVDTFILFQKQLEEGITNALQTVNLENIQDAWDGLETVITKTAEDTLGFKDPEQRSP